MYKGGRVGIANAGYWGIPVTPSTTYQVSFYARSSQPGSGPLTVDLETDSGQVYASSTVSGETATATSWMPHATSVSAA